jgi:hypothetical protein
VNKYQAGTQGFLNKWEEKSRCFIHDFFTVFDKSKWSKLLPSKNTKALMLDISSDEESSSSKDSDSGDQDEYFQPEPAKKRLKRN